MKLDLTPARTNYVSPQFGGDEQELPPELQHRMRRPMLVGAGVIGAFVVGLGLWASVSSLATGITAMAEVRADTMRKTLRAKEVGT